MNSSAKPPIDDQAAAWALKLAEGEPSEDERQQFDAWLGEKPAHREAFEEAQKVLRMVDAAAELANKRELEKELREAARRARLKSVIVAIVAASSMLVGSTALLRHGRGVSGWDSGPIGAEMVAIASR